MAYPYSITTRATGTTLTAAIYNADHQAHADNQTPENTDDYSTNAAEMQATTDPYPASSESLATTLDGELQRLRYIIKQITNQAQWYVDPTWTSVTWATANFNATGAVGTERWILTSGSQQVFRYTELGTCMILQISLVNTGVSGTPSSLKLKIPNARTVSVNYIVPMVIQDSGTWRVGLAQTYAASGKTLLIKAHVSGGAWAASNSNTTVQGQIVLDFG